MTTIAENEYMYVREHIRTVPDFPKKGIMFRDITSVLQDPWI